MKSGDQEMPIRRYAPIWDYVVLGISIGISLLVIILFAGTLMAAEKCGPQEVPQEVPREVLCEDPCESGWIWHNRKCYFFSDEYDTWENSQRFCASRDASLAHIDSEGELRFLHKFDCRDSHWIGLRWNTVNNAWTWTNGTPLTAPIFTIKSVSANSERSECVFLNQEGVKSQNGEFENKWVCSKPSQQRAEIHRSGSTD